MDSIKIAKIIRGNFTPDNLWFNMETTDESNQPSTITIHCDVLMGIIQYAAYAASHSNQQRGLGLPFFDTGETAVFAMEGADKVGLGITLGPNGHLHFALEPGKAAELGNLLLQGAAKILGQRDRATH